MYGVHSKHNVGFCISALKINYITYEKHTRGDRCIPEFPEMSQIVKMVFSRNPGNSGNSRKFPEIPRKIPRENSGFFLIFRL